MRHNSARLRRTYVLWILGKEGHPVSLWKGGAVMNAYKEEHNYA